MIPESFIQEVLARTDIVSLIERYVPLKKGGANYMACCPFHNEKSPSFTVSPTKQFYHCFGCGAHGTAVGFLMEYSGMSFRDAIKDLAGQAGLQIPEDNAPQQDRSQINTLLGVMERAARYFRDQLRQSPKAIEYLKQRGLTGEIAKQFGIGYAPEDWQGLKTALGADYETPAPLEAGMVIQNDTGRRYDRFRDRVMFPILDQRGNIIGFGGRVIGQGEPKYLNSPETPLFEKGRELYGLFQARQAIRDSGVVVVVEGYMDVVALAQYGFGSAVATLGTATTATHIQKLFRQSDKVVFCFDGDNAGRKAARRALEACLDQLGDDREARFLFLPPEHDPDTFVRVEGLEAFHRAVHNAQPLSEFLLRELRSDLNLGTAEDRSRLVHEAKTLVPKISAPVLQQQIVRMIADDVEMPIEAVLEALEIKAPSQNRFGPGAGRKAPRQRTPRVAPTGNLKKLLRLICAYPTLIEKLPGDILELAGDGPIHDVIQSFLDIRDTDGFGPTSLAGLYESTADEARKAELLELLQAPPPEFELDDATVQEFDGLIINLRIALNDHEFSALHQRIMQGELLSPDEMQYYKTLTERKQALRSSRTGQNAA